MKPYIVTLIVVIISVSSMRSQSDLGAWTPLGPMEGGEVQWLGYQQGTLMAGLRYGGLALSTNEGTSWTMVPGTKDVIVTNAIVRGDTIIAALTIKGIGVTTDAGQSWNIYRPEQPHVSPTGMMFIRDTIVVHHRGVIHLSGDLGHTWESFPAENWSYSVGIGDLILASIDNYLRYSSDLGRTWTKCEGPDGPMERGHVQAPITQIGDRFYAFIDYVPGVCVTSDSGRSWSIFNASTEYADLPVIYHPDHSLIYKPYAPPRSSYDDLQTTVEERNGLPPVYPYTVACMSEAHMFIGTPQGVYRKQHGSDRWEYVASGMTGVQVNATIDYENRLIAATQQGLFASDDDGATWSAVDTYQFWAPYKDLWVFRDTLHASVLLHDAVSVDGRRWYVVDSLERKEFDEAFGSDSVVVGVRHNSLWYAKHDSSLQYIVTPGPSGLSTFATNGREYVYTKGSSFWIGEDVAWPAALVQQEHRVPERIYDACIDKDLTVFIAGWRAVHRAKAPFYKVTEIMPAGGPLDEVATVQVVDLGPRGSHLLVGKESGIFLSRTNGDSWEDISDNGPVATVRGIDQIGSTLYVATNGEGLWTLDLLRIVSVPTGSVSNATTCFSAGSASVDGDPVLPAHNEGIVEIDLLGRQWPIGTVTGSGLIQYCPVCGTHRKVLR